MTEIHVRWYDRTGDLIRTDREIGHPAPDGAAYVQHEITLESGVSKPKAPYSDNGRLILDPVGPCSNTRNHLVNDHGIAPASSLGEANSIRHMVAHLQGEFNPRIDGKVTPHYHARGYWK